VAAAAAAAVVTADTEPVPLQCRGVCCLLVHCWCLPFCLLCRGLHEHRRLIPGCRWTSVTVSYRSPAQSSWFLAVSKRAQVRLDQWRLTLLGIGGDAAGCQL